MIKNVEIRCRGDLPIYLPLPDDIRIRSTEIGVNLTEFRTQVFEPERAPDEGHGNNVDDGMGNYSRSRMLIVFETQIEVDDDTNEVDQHTVVNLVINVVNQIIEVIRYVSLDPKIVPIRGIPGETVFQVIDLDSDDDPQSTLAMFSTWWTSPLPSPFGISIRQTLDVRAMNRIEMLLGSQMSLNPAWLLVVDAERDANFLRVERTIINLAIALEIHIPNLVEEYRSHIPASVNLAQVDYSKIYSLYDDGLQQLVNESLHSEPQLFEALEYIRVLRNAVAHSWTPVFDATKLQGRYRSRYVQQHQTKHGHRVTDSEELEELVEATKEILRHVEDLFEQQFPRN